MQPGTKYRIVSRHNGMTVDGFILDNLYFTEVDSAAMQIGEITDGKLRHRNPVKADGSEYVLKVDGLTLIDDRGDVFDLIAQ
ncbi:hypothetical protein [Pseudomonas tohonis]|uniref:hypothetical protein n=1 Tax=Pseudomonas tohonis TaxID=2725477 RepID=UPI001F240F60|nr:hypothetical protein [Pseudomonas tohonis]